MTYQYEIGDLEIKRLFKSKSMQGDRFAVKHKRRVLVEVDYATARALWLGRMSVDEVMQKHGKQG